LPLVQLIWSEYYLDSIPHAENLKGSFWWRDVLKQVDNFRGVARVKPGRGDTFLFWLDSWYLNDSFVILKDKFPRLFSFSLDDHVSTANVFNTQDISSLF
jgi:hypothetical protein